MRQTEAMELLKLEAEHNTRMNSLYAELEGVREELDIRTRVIGAEMVRWRAQAEAAAAAVRDAKDEVRSASVLIRCIATLSGRNAAHGPQAGAGRHEGAHGRACREAVCRCAVAPGACCLRMTTEHVRAQAAKRGWSCAGQSTRTWSAFGSSTPRRCKLSRSLLLQHPSRTWQQRRLPARALLRRLPARALLRRLLPARALLRRLLSKRQPRR